MGIPGLGTLDVVLLLLSLLASAAIGIYHGVKGLHQSSTDYLLGERMLKPLPLAMSLTVGTVSAITIMGNAGEMYVQGSQIWMMDVGLTLGMWVVAEAFIPIFYPMKMISLYHYIEARFKSTWLRRGTVILTLGGAYFFIGFLLYPPSLILQNFTGLSITENIIVTGLVCSVYSSFGGVKAVVYADVLQSLIMVAGSLAIVIQGTMNVGGLSQVMDIAYHHGRIEFFNLNLDPWQRHSFWLVIINGFFFSLATYGVNQSQTQRTFSTSSIKDAKRVIYYAIVGMLLLKSLANLSGLVIFANFVGCDPLTKNGQQVSDIAIVIHYVLTYLTKIPGLAGLFVASIYAAVLSSVSTQVNSMTALVWEDFLKVVPFFQKWSDQMVTRFQKVLVMMTGVVGIVTGILVSVSGRRFLSGLLAITGAVWGPMVGLFFVAVFFPWVKARGAGLGFLVSIFISTWIALGQFITQSEPQILPLSRENCPSLNATDTPITSPIQHANTSYPQPKGVGLYGISYCLNSFWGFIIAILVALLFTAFTSSNTTSDVEEKLIHRKAWIWFTKGIKQSARDSLKCFKPSSSEGKNRCIREKNPCVNEEELQSMKTIAV